MNEDNIKKENWFSQHVDTFLIIGSIAGALIWNNCQFNQLTREIFLVKEDISQVKIDVSEVKCQLTREISEVKQEVAIIKTVLIMKNICPHELAVNQEKKDE